MGKALRRGSWGLMTFLALAIVLYASSYLTLNPAIYFEPQRAVYEARIVGLIAHIVGGMLALSLGPFQFLAGLRNRLPRLHRWLGRLYLCGITLGGLGGLYMATTAYTGPIAGLGFGALALAWLTTGALAFISIGRGDVAAHRGWMLRNFALTFAAVTLRLELPLLSALLGMETGYRVVAWSCWLPNLLLAHWLLTRPGRQTTALRRSAVQA